MICILAGQRPYPERARELHFPRSGSQSQREIRFILPAHGARHIINLFLSKRAGKINRILQSDWFRERAEFSDLARGQRNKPDAVCETK